MNQHDFEHPPLGKVVKGLESDADLTPEEIKADLINKGYNPDAFVSRMEAQARALAAESRLAWMKQADTMQFSADAAFATFTSWTQRSIEEISEAFTLLIEGHSNASAQLRLRSAFSNVSKLTSQDKAAFLDEVHALMEIEKKAKDASRGQEPK